jgi:DNA/RNA endonuclease YhcR with UshA esterase domain
MRRRYPEIVMKTTVIAVFAVVLIVGISFVARAQDTATSQPTSQPSNSMIDPGDKAAIEANMNKDVTIDGVVDTANWASSGKVMRIEFKNNQQTKLQAIVFEKKKKELDDSFSGDFAKTLNGAHVRIKGQLKIYRDRPEVVIDNAQQVTILEPGPSTPTTAPAGT